jgi:hypothetical protein
MAVSGVQIHQVVGHNSDNINVYQSNNAGNSGFKFVIDVYVNGVTFWGQNYLRFYVPTIAGTNQCRFNISQVLRDLAVYQLPQYIGYSNTMQEITSALGSKVTIKVGEAYYTTPTTYSIYPNLYSHDCWLVYHTYNKNETAIDYYPLNTSMIDRRKLNKFFLVPFNYLWINMFANSLHISSGKIFGAINLLQSNGGEIFLAQAVANNNLQSVTTNNRLFNFLIGVSIVDVSGNNYTFYDTLNSIFTNVNKFNINQHFGLAELPDEYLQAIFQYEVVRCLSNDGIMLYWINSLGQVDSWYFPIYKRKRSIVTTDVKLPKQRDFQSTFGERYYSREDISITATSYIIDNDADMLGLADLFSAKYVWYNTADNTTLRQCFIIDKNVEIKKYKTDKLYQVTININDGYKIIA